MRKIECARITPLCAARNGRFGIALRQQEWQTALHLAEPFA